MIYKINLIYSAKIQWLNHFSFATTYYFINIFLIASLNGCLDKNLINDNFYS